MFLLEEFKYYNFQKQPFEDCSRRFKSSDYPSESAKNSKLKREVTKEDHFGS
jgi:hypothetical protein